MKKFVKEHDVELSKIFAKLWCILLFIVMIYSVMMCRFLTAILTFIAFLCIIIHRELITIITNDIVLLYDDKCKDLENQIEDMKLKLKIESNLVLSINDIEFLHSILPILRKYSITKYTIEKDISDIKHPKLIIDIYCDMVVYTKMLIHDHLITGPRYHINGTDVVFEK